MTDIVTPGRPLWLRLFAILLTLWGLMGIGAFYMDLGMSEAARATLPAWDQQFYRTRPEWFVWLYGVAVWGGLLGSIGLLLGRRWAVPLYAASLVSTVIQFGWVFAATDLIAAKGAAVTLPFPLLIIAIAVAQLWIATAARRRRWLA